MDLRSEEAPERYHLGIRWGTLNGRSGWMHVWSDGTTLPVIAGCAPDDDDTDDDDDDGDKGGKDDDDDEEEEEDDDEDDDDEEDPDKIKDPKRRESARQAARYRVQRNTARKERDEARQERDTVKAELKKLKAEGGTDETLKARVKELEDEVAKKDDDIKKLGKAANDAKVLSAVRKAVDELDVTDDIDFVMYTLERSELLPEVDPEDNSVDEVEAKRNVRKLIRKKKLSVTSGDDGEDEEEDEKAGGRASGSPSKRSAPKSFNSEKKGKGSGKTRAQLAEKYPALANR